MAGRGRFFPFSPGSSTSHFRWGTSPSTCRPDTASARTKAALLSMARSWSSVATCTNTAGRSSSVPLGRFYGLTGIGLPIMASHRYRVRVVYENPTGHTIATGGMGVVGGLFIPRRGAVWPSAEPSNGLYQQDVRHFTGLTGGRTSGMEGMAGMGAMDSDDNDHGSTP